MKIEAVIIEKKEEDKMETHLKFFSWETIIIVYDGSAGLRIAFLFLFLLLPLFILFISQTLRNFFFIYILSISKSRRLNNLRNYH